MKTRLLLALISSLCLAAGDALRADTNINETKAFSWAANVGFLNWRGDGSNGVVVGRYILSGFIYGANIGWIDVGDGTPADGIHYANASADDFGVNTISDPNVPGELSLRGYAYAANVGWINFEPTGNPRVLLSNGRLRGFAYAATFGWINLDDLDVFVQANAIDPGADTDADTLADAWEYIHFGDLEMNGSGDPDADGQDNRFEYIAGLAPTDPSSVFRLRIEAVPGQPQQKRLIFSPRLVDRTYIPQFTTTLPAGAWEPLSSATQQDNAAERIVTDLNASGPARFYRVQISAP